MIKSQDFLKEIKEYLSQEKNIELLDTQINGDSSNYLQAKDNINSYRIKIISLIDKNDYFSDSLLNDAKQEAKAYKRCQNPNILKYYMEFQYNNHYFIVLEGYEMTLYDWICKNKERSSLEISQFIRFSLEILSALLCIHKKLFVLRWFSLKSIKLDKNLTIKLSDFGIPKKVEQETLNYELDLGDSRLLLAPEMTKQDKEIKIKVEQNRKSDVWSIGICLYMLAGGQPFQIIQMNQEMDAFQILNDVHEDVNYLLLNILQTDPFVRPSIPFLIQSFINLRQNINDDSSEYLAKNGKQKESQSYLKIFQKGLKQYNLKNYDESFELLSQVLKINPQCDIAYHKMGNIKYIKNEDEIANIFFEDAIRFNKQFDVVIYNLGNYYKRTNRLQNATLYYKQAIQINNLFEQFHYNLGNTYMTQSLNYQAIIHYQKAIELDPSKSSAYKNLTSIYFKQQNYDKALRLCKKNNSLNILNYLFMIKQSI